MLNNNIQIRILMSSFCSLIHCSPFDTLFCAMETTINYITWVTSANGEYCREIWAQDKRSRYSLLHLQTQVNSDSISIQKYPSPTASFHCVPITAFSLCPSRLGVVKSSSHWLPKPQSSLLSHLWKYPLHSNYHLECGNSLCPPTSLRNRNMMCNSN